MGEKNKNPGPDPERLKLPHRNWKDALAEAIRKKKPEDWPEDEDRNEDDDPEREKGG